MALADDFQPVDPGFALWHAYDPKAKAELFSTAAMTPLGLLLVDPIRLAQPAEDELLASGPVAGIVVTNDNHWRAAAALGQKWKAQLFAHSSLTDSAPAPFQPVSHGDRILNDAHIISLAGAAPGEIALCLPEHGGSLIVGDALIHFDPYGFTFLPAKYCTDHVQMRQSLRSLLPCRAERMFFAHGQPILANLPGRLERLLHDA